MTESRYSDQSGMTPKRLESLADAIFAFAMTLLVLSINLPEGGNIQDIGDFLSSQSQSFLNFFLSFVLLAFVWLTFSQQFHHIRKTDMVMIMLSIFTLFFVVLLPFSTSLMNDYSSSVTAEVFFSGNLMVLYSLMAANWLYVVRKDMLTISPEDEHIKRATMGSLFLPVIPALGVILAFIVPGWSTLVYLLIPLMIFLPVHGKK